MKTLTVIDTKVLSNRKVTPLRSLSAREGGASLRVDPMGRHALSKWIRLVDQFNLAM